MLDWRQFTDRVARIRGELGRRRVVIASLEQNITCGLGTSAHQDFVRHDRGTPPGRKGVMVLFRDYGQDCRAIIIDVLAPTRALIRACEGPLAGQEIEAEFPAGHLDYWSDPSKPLARPKPLLSIIDGGVDR